MLEACLKPFDFQAVTFDSINNLWVRNLRMENSPKFHLTFENCVGVEANYLRVSAPQYSPNTDGIHISASTYVMVTDSIVGTGMFSYPNYYFFPNLVKVSLLNFTGIFLKLYAGDDCISIISGSFNVLIQNITCGLGHGIRYPSI